MGLFLFALALLLSLLLIPLGLPGLWVMIGAAVVYNALSSGFPIGVAALVVVLMMATVAEVLEFTLAGRYTRRFGGSRTGARWAIVGGIVGAILGIPFPVPFVGSVIGAFVGSFAGALFGELRVGSSHGQAGRAATGALLGRVVAAALKVGIGVAIAVILLMAAWL
ncbi:MAG TPA: DUF456 domain-containing protein [Gemmatimonadaceae bacterium]|nr:DUF456 domain-containing protein [Gemmatimonadaceae bacterium]